MQLIPNNGEILIDKDAPPLLAHVETPKVEDMFLRYGQFIGYPLRAPRESEYNISGAFEAQRFVVLSIVPDERPEMAWTMDIKPGDCVTMTRDPHVEVLRVDLAGQPLGEIVEHPDAEGKVVGHALCMNSGQILTWDRREINRREYSDIGKGMLAAQKAAAEREAMLSKGPNG